MKILHISTGFPFSFQGGITNYVRSIANSQVKAGHDVHVLCNNDDNTNKNITYHFLESKLKAFSFEKLEDKKSLKYVENILEENDFDIIHIHMALQLDWELAKIVKKYKYVVSLHDYYYLCPRIEMIPKQGEICRYRDGKRCEECISLLQCNRVTNKLVRIYKQITGRDFPNVKQKITTRRFENLKKILENAEILLPVSNRVKEIYMDSNIDGNYKVLHIGNISADLYKEAFTYNMEPHKMKLLFLGRLSYNKGVNVLVNIADRVDKEKVEVHFYGNAASNEELLKEHGIINHGKYIQTELPSILQEFDMGMVLSIWEDNGPQVVMELLNNHLPVIGTKMGGISDFVTMENGYIFDPYSGVEFDKLIDFINGLTPEKVYELKKNIKPTMTTDEHYNEIMKIYSDVLKEEKKV